MIIAFEVFLSLIRIFLLLIGTLIVYVLGASVYTHVNGYLIQWSAPCIEIITSLVTIIPIIALFYGIHVQKFFWKRENDYNKKIFLISFAFGILIALIPWHSAVPASSELLCRTPIQWVDKIVYAIVTGALTSLLAAIGMDIGVLLKHSSKRIVSTKSTKSGKKSAKRRKK